MIKPNLKTGLGIAAGLCLAVPTAVMLWPDRPAAARPSVQTAPLEPFERVAMSVDEIGSIRHDLGKALGQHSGISDRERLVILGEFSGDLSQLEADVLADELLRPPKPGEEIAWYAEYFHSLCLILREQEKFRERFARVLATVVADPTRDQTVRDYGMQHLAAVWELSSPGDGLRASVLATFGEVIRGDKEMAAPALLSLHLLGSGFNRSREIGDAANSSYHVPDSDILPFVEEAIGSSAVTSTEVGLKMVALRVVAERRMTGLLPAVREIAGERLNEHAVTRMAAISAIGRLGDSDDRVFLETLERDDPRIIRAVGHALEILSES